MVELFEEAGFPAGDDESRPRRAAEAGEALVRNPGVNVVLFTGSYEVGQRIQQLSAEHYDRIVAAEMGSKSAVIVCEDARLDLAVNGGIISGFKTSGQRCVSASRILVARIAHRSLRGASSSPRRSGCESATRSTRQLHRAGHPPRRGRKGRRLQRTGREGRREGVARRRTRMTGGEHAEGCYLSPFVYRMEIGRDVRVTARGSLRAACRADPVQNQ